MKRLLLFSFALLGSLALTAQDTETLFKNATITGGFGGPIFEYSTFDGNYQPGAGGGGGIVAKNFFIGGFGMGFSDLAEVRINNQTYELGLGYGGIWLGYTPLTHKVIHPYVSGRIGWGTAELEPIDEDLEDIEDRIMALTPEIGLELNVFKWFRVSGAASYRFITGVGNLPDFSNEDFSNFGGILTLRFGGF